MLKNFPAQKCVAAVAMKLNADISDLKIMKLMVYNEDNVKRS